MIKGKCKMGLILESICDLLKTLDEATFTFNEHYLKYAIA
jgi:hypothetical protein